MTGRPQLAQLATELLARDVPMGRAEARVDERAIEALRATIEAEARKRRSRQWSVRGLAGAALAAAVVCALGGLYLARAHHPVVTAVQPPVARAVTAVAHAVAGGVVVLHGGQEVSIEGGAPLVARDRLVAAADGRASIVLSTGSHLALEGGADVTVVESEASQQVFSLRVGALRADVTKLRSGERFMVRTGDAEVEVRGTSFRVAVVDSDPSCGGGSSTRVAVTEGTVVVRTSRGEDRVQAGEEWPRGCALSKILPVLSPTKTQASPRPRLPDVVPTRDVSPPPSAAAPSELAAQNLLFAQATSARRSGETTSAIDLYERFLSRYPSSSLVEGAAVERMRLLATADRTRAQQAAHAYLAAFPSGFAREEARKMIAGEP